MSFLSFAGDLEQVQPDEMDTTHCSSIMWMFGWMQMIGRNLKTLVLGLTK